MIPTPEKCYDGGEHKPVTIERIEAYVLCHCEKCGLLAESKKGREPERVFRIPTCHKEPEKVLDRKSGG